jgi:hypothetical protein
MAPTDGHFSGAYEALWIRRDSNGYPKGISTTPDAVSNGSTHHAYRLPGLVQATAPGVTRGRVSWRGGMKHRGSRGTGLEDFGDFQITVAGFDETFHSLVTGSVADATNGGSNNVIIAPNSNLADKPQGFLILTRGFQTRSGANKYMHWMYNNVTLDPIDPEFNQNSGENPQPVVYQVVPSQSQRTVFGLPLSALSVAVEDASDYYIMYRTDERISVTTYIDDNSATSFSTQYLPVSDDHAGVTNVWTTAGSVSHANVSGYSTSTGATTHTAASAGAIWVVVYGTRYRLAS